MEYCLEKIDTSHLQHRFEAISSSVIQLQPWFPWMEQNYSIEKCENWITDSLQNWANNKDHNFAIIDSANYYCGEVKIMDVKRDYAERNASLAYWIVSDKTQQGIATFAIREAARFAFNELNLIRLNIMTQLDNIPSQKTAIAAGAKFEGILRNQWDFGDDNIFDVKLYSLIPQDLEE